MKDVHIRKAQESDLHEIKSLMLELIESLESEEGIDENVVLKNCRKILKAPNAHLLVAELDGEIVGVLHLNVRRTLLHSAPSGLIDELVVSERHRGKGIGRKLIEAAVELSDLLPAVNGEGSNGLTPRHWREGLRAHHPLPLPVSVQPEGTVLCPLPLTAERFGVIASEATLQSFQPLKSGF